MESAARASLSRARERWNAGDLVGYLGVYDPSVKLHGYGEPLDYAGVVALYESIFSAFTEPQLTFHEVIESNDTVTVRFSMTGRHEGTFNSIPATGVEIVLDGITILRFAGDRCVERWSCADMLGLMVQLGAVPAPT